MASPSSDVSGTEETPKRRGWGPARGLLAVIVAFVGAEVVIAFVLPFVAGLILSNQAAVDTWINSVTGSFFYVLLTEVFTLFILWRMLRRYATLAEIGLGRSPQAGDLGWAILAGLAYFVVFLVVISAVSAAFHINIDQKQELGFDNIVGSGKLLLTFLSLVVFPPFVEETLFRGVLYTGFRKRTSFVQAALLTSVLFAAPHLFETSGGLLWVAAIDTFILSLALCYLREKTKSLWPGIILHTIKNGVAFVSLYLFVGR